MTLTREKKIWLFAIGVSVLFHALFFVWSINFQSKKVSQPIIVRLVEKQKVNASRALSVKKENAKEALPKKSAVVPQKVSMSKEKPKQISENNLSNSTEITEQSANKAGQISGSTERSGVVSGATGETAGNAAAEIVDVTALVITKKVTPVYPAFSRKRKEEGTVQLLITILDNSVTECKIERSSGYARLDEVARRAVSQWKFSHSGTVKARVPIMFKISD